MTNLNVIDSRIVKNILTSLQELREEVFSLKKIISNRVITENGFTPEFEKRVIVSSKEPISKSITWDGKSSFVDHVLKKDSK